MASDDGSNHHEEWEWENQRENFTVYYKTENKTLKDAARCMSDFHGFYATPRQWERKVKLWGLEKYTTRQARMQQLEGRSIHEVARAGRRQRPYEDSLLHPEHVDDRNIRRFARRELSRSGSRSRSRSRSNSFGQRSRTASPMLEEHQSDEVVQEATYALDFSPLLQSGALHDPNNSGPIQVPAVPIDHDSYNPQAHVLQIQDSITGETSGQVFLSLPEQGAMQPALHDTDALGHSQYNFADIDRRFSVEAMQPPQLDMEPPSRFPLLETAEFDERTSFMSSQNETMEDISPTFHGVPSGSWLSQTLPTLETNMASNFLPNPPSYHVTPTSDTGPSMDFQGNAQPLSTPQPGVPTLVFPSSPTPSHLEISMNSQYGDNYEMPQPVSHRDQQIYADFYASVNRYSQSVIDAVTTSAASIDDRTHVLKTLASELTLQSKS